MKKLKYIKSTDGNSYGRLKETHINWWNEYYKKSFLSVPEPALESFYWIQMYKLACAIRADRAVMDNQGSWLQETPMKSLCCAGV